MTPQSAITRFMSKQLNIPLVSSTAEAQGLTQTAIAAQLEVTKAAVSKWLTGKSHPRPPELLKLGKLLGLGYKDLTIESKAEPLIAFRRRASCKTTPKHINRAKAMGRCLEPLTSYLDFDPFLAPGYLKDPNLGYEYIQKLVTTLRREMNLSDHEPIGFKDLINKFRDQQAVLIPTLWGKKDKHENALHIYLSESKTTWIYLNLDSEIHDFKFWMAHELAHVLSVNLLEQDQLDLAEDFADRFAGALLFPEAAAKTVYKEYAKARSDRGRTKVLMETGSEYTISPNSVYQELKQYAEVHEQPFTELDNKVLFPAINQFNKKFPTLSEHLFDGETPSANSFMRVAQEQFDTHFYKALGEYVRKTNAPPSAISRMIDVPLLDARAYHEALTTAG